MRSASRAIRPRNGGALSVAPLRCDTRLRSVVGWTSAVANGEVRRTSGTRWGGGPPEARPRMSFTVSTGSARLPRTDLAVPRSRPVRGELEFEARVAPGIIVTWDPATPSHCVAVTVAPEARTASGRTTSRSAVTDRTPWLRLAAVTMLEDRLYLPLNRSLLDAEIASAQVAAARTLSRAEPIRDHLVDQALVRARHAARGVVQYLERLGAARECPPAPLGDSLGALAESYLALSEEVDDLDTDLAAVTEAVRRLTFVASSAPRVDGDIAVPESAPSGTAQIDPRLLPTRILRLGPAVDSAEIDVAPVRAGDRSALRVRVPAFAASPRPADLPDVGVRLIHRRTGRVHGYGLLGLPYPFGGRFEGTVSLPDAVSADDVRVELYDASGPPPEEVSTDDAALRRVRRATLFLAGWRALLADVRLRGPGSRPAARLRAVTRALAADTEGALWAGGPALSHLCQLAELGDRKLAALLRGRGPASPTSVSGDDDGGAAAVVNSVAGPGDLLTAEMAAAYDRVVSA